MSFPLQEFYLANHGHIFRGGGQILERRNVERPIFRNFKIANIKMTKDELFDSFIFEFNFSYPLDTQSI